MRGGALALAVGLVVCCLTVLSGLASVDPPRPPAREPVEPVGGVVARAVAEAGVEKVREQDGASAVERVAIERRDGPRRVRVRVVRDLGDGEQRAFPPGAVTVRANASEAPEWHHQLRRPPPAEFEVPAGATTVSFQSGSYRQVTRRLPDVSDAVIDLGTIVLDVEGAVLLRVWNAPSELRAALVAEALVAGQHLCGRVPLHPQKDHLSGRIPFVLGSTELRLFSTRSGFVFNLPRAQRLPGVGSHTHEPVVDLDLAALPSASVRVVGVPDVLLPHVELLWDCDGGRLRDVVADERGELRMIGLPRGLPFEASRLYVSTAAGGKVPLRTAQGQVDLRFVSDAEVEVEVAPQQDLLGIAAFAPDAEAFELAIGSVTFRGPARDVHVVGTRDLAETQLLAVREAGAEARLVARDDLIVDGVLRRVPERTAPATASLVVRPRVPCADPGRYLVLLEDLDTGVGAGLPWRDGAFRSDLLPAGRYRVERKWRFTTVEVLAEELHLERGASVELVTSLHGARERVGTITNWASLDRAARPVGIVVDGLVYAKPDEHGAFSFVAPAIEGFDSRIVLKFADGSVREPAGSGAEAGRLQLLAPELMVVPVRSPLLEGRHACSVRIDDGPVLEVNGKCLLAVGEVARGVWRGVPPELLQAWSERQYEDFRAYATGAARSHACGWFELRATREPQPVDVGRGARFVAVDIRRRVSSFEVRVHGPEGWPSVLVFDGVQAGVVQVLVVDGTTAIEVVCDGVSQRHAVDVDRVLVE